MAGVLEAVTRAMGGVINDLSGFRFTRLALPMTAGDANMMVETTFGWPSPGIAVLDGILYHYESVTPTALVNVSWFDGATEVPGAQIDHEVASEVLDYSRTFSDIEKLRSGFFVNTAEEADLSTVGRNISVDRPPTLADDDIYREVIKALAYTPKGTLFALDIALTAFFGAGNYELWEDLIGFPNTVFIALTGALSLDDFAEGKTYLGKDLPLAYDDVNDTITLPETPVGVIEGARLEDEIGEFPLDVQLPSAFNEIRFDGDAGIPVWTFDALGSGATEGVEVQVVATDGGSTRFNFTGGPALRARYFRHARIQPQSDAYLENVLRFASLTNNSFEENWHMRIDDGEHHIRMGFFYGGVGLVNVGAATSAGASIAGLTPFPANEYASYAIQKDETQVYLLRNGIIFQTLPRADFDAATATTFSWGEPNVNEAPDVFVRAVFFNAHTPTDYLNARGVLADVLTVEPSTLDTNSGLIIGADLGKALRTFDGVALNPEGGRNNGSWTVETVVDADEVTLVGATKYNAFVESVHPARITAVADPKAFRFPDDRGKLLEILGGGINAGTTLVTHIMDPVSGYPISGDLEDTSDQALAVGDPTGVSGSNGTLSNVNPDRFTDPTSNGGNSWTISDVGRVILVRQAGNGVNAGVFQITNYIAPDEVEVNSVSVGQPFATETGIAWEMRESPGFSTELGLDYRLKPNFVDEAGLSWELTGAADIAGPVITLRVDPPFDFVNIELIMRVTYSMVLSAQVLPDADTVNEAVPATDPVEYTFYPFYMPANALGAFESFIDELTVAGVIPDLLF